MSHIHLSQKEYKAAIEVLSEASQHVELIAKRMEKSVLNTSIMNYAKDTGENLSLLDVGSGTGDLTRKIAHHFTKVVTVEPNIEMKSFYEGTTFHKYFLPFQEFRTAEKFDVILCSHVLYQMPVEEMKAFIEKLLSHGQVGSTVVIALMAPRGENHELHTHFNKSYINSGHIKQILESLNISFKTYTDTNYFKPKSLFQLKSLVKFFVYEDCISRTEMEAKSDEEQKWVESEIDRIVNSKIDPHQITQEEDYFVIEL